MTEPRDGQNPAGDRDVALLPSGSDGGRRTGALGTRVHPETETVDQRLEREVNERPLNPTLEVATFEGGHVQVGHGKRCVAVIPSPRGGFVLTPLGARQLAALLARQADACERVSS